MARKKNNVDKEYRELLSRQVEAVYGKKIRRSFECERLSFNIQKSIETYVSPQTLRRFFGFIDTEFSPSSHTLNVLSLYCGYSDWEDFMQQDIKKIFMPLTSIEEIQLYLDFYKIKLHDEMDINYHNASRVISTRILQNPRLFEALMIPLAETPAAQVYFFERFPYIDGICSGYHRGIKLYLQNKRGTEGKVYGLSLLLFGAFLSKKKKDLHFYFEKLQHYKPHSSWHPFLIARWIGSALLYHHVNANENEKMAILKQIREYHGVFKKISNIRFWKFPYYQFMIGDYLNLVKENSLAYEFLHPLKITGITDILVEDGYFDALCISSRTAACFLHRTEREIIQWPHPDFDRIGFIFKKYYRIWHLLGEEFKISSGKKKKKEKLQQEIRLLIQQTGFLYFEEFLKI